MLPEAAVATSQAAPDSKVTANSIAKAVTDRATGKAPAARGPETPADGDEKGKVKAPAATADPNAGKKKYVVEGREVYLTPEQADAYVQKGLAFEPKVSELARMKQEFNQLQEAMLNNPGLILTNLAKRANVPIQAIVEKVLSGTASDEVKEATGRWYWENVAKRHQMDPKDREILEKDERIKMLEAQDKQKAEMAIAMENRAKVVKALGDVSAQIKETLTELGIKNVDSAAGIRITKEIADVMRISYFSKQPCTAKQAAEKVKARIHEYQRQFYDDLDMDQLVETLGKDNAEKVRKYFLKTVQDAEKGTRQEGGRPAGAVPKRDERKTMNMDEFHDYLDDLKRKSK